MNPQDLETARAAHRKMIQERLNQLPPCNAPVHANTCVTYPTGDYRLDIEMHKGLLSSFAKGLFAAEITCGGNSDIGSARNRIFNSVLRTPFEWIVCIDTDIGFTVEDLMKLLFLASPIDYAVQGVYAKKNDKDEAVIQGLGFSRIHRSVLEAIVTHMPFCYQDEVLGECQDFCITGATEKMGMLREDSGFWFLCSQIGVTPRLVRDVNLRHYGGRRAYELSSVHRLQT